MEFWRDIVERVYYFLEAMRESSLVYDWFKFQEEYFAKFFVYLIDHVYIP